MVNIKGNTCESPLFYKLKRCYTDITVEAVMTVVVIMGTILGVS